MNKANVRIVNNNNRSLYRAKTSLSTQRSSPWRVGEPAGEPGLSPEDRHALQTLGHSVLPTCLLPPCCPPPPQAPGAASWKHSTSSEQGLPLRDCDLLSPPGGSRISSLPDLLPGLKCPAQLPQDHSSTVMPPTGWGTTTRTSLCLEVHLSFRLYT